MKARLVRSGNSRGIRLPKPIIEEAGLARGGEIRKTRPSANSSTWRGPRMATRSAAFAADPRC